MIATRVHRIMMMALLLTSLATIGALAQGQLTRAAS